MNFLFHTFSYVTLHTLHHFSSDTFLLRQSLTQNNHIHFLCQVPTKNIQTSNSAASRLLYHHTSKNDFMCQQQIFLNRKYTFFSFKKIVSFSNALFCGSIYSPRSTFRVFLAPVIVAPYQLKSRFSSTIKPTNHFQRFRSYSGWVIVMSNGSCQRCNPCETSNNAPYQNRKRPTIRIHLTVEIIQNDILCSH